MYPIKPEYHVNVDNNDDRLRPTTTITCMHKSRIKRRIPRFRGLSI